MSVGSIIETIDDLEFIKGEKLVIGPSETEQRRVTVVEFCPHLFVSSLNSRKGQHSIPHLTEVQKKYKDKDVYLVGVTNERNKRQIEQFVSQMGSQMDYTVALDPSNSAQEALMVPAGARGIPHAFILTPDNKVAWHGHPMEPAFEQELEKAAKSATPRIKVKPILESEDELMKRSVKDLKALLQERGVYFADCVEKSDLAKRIVERCSKV
ncbi:hypothetical protein HDU93_008488 [Gonapodya sp. JEL0774]|nr:hypothetical protein HDU93_008488 [Gonapodya sp. JEL0774]